jgi:hypothetical protein
MTLPQIPVVKFDRNRVTEEVREDLRRNIRTVPEFQDSRVDLNVVYEAALRSILAGRDLHILATALTSICVPGVTNKRAGEIALFLNNRATALMNRRQQQAIGIREAIWMYSGAPCQVNPKHPSPEDIRQDRAHREADRKRFHIAEGMLVDGKRTYPGEQEGCRCFSRPITPGFEQ